MALLEFILDILEWAGIFLVIIYVWAMLGLFFDKVMK